jgi:hypothetical protein
MFFFSLSDRAVRRQPAPFFSVNEKKVPFIVHGTEKNASRFPLFPAVFLLVDGAGAAINIIGGVLSGRQK